MKTHDDVHPVKTSSSLTQQPWKRFQKSKLAEVQAEKTTSEGDSEADRESPQLKTYIVKFAIRQPDPDGGASYRDDYSTGLVRAENVHTAQEEAMKLHIPEAFETPPSGDWIMDGKECFGFRIEGCAPVDEGCEYWIEGLVEVRPEDVATIERYLLNW